MAEAVGNIAKGAAAGDDQLAAALDLLRQNKTAEASVLLRSVAEDRAARIQKDRKDAATAYRNLGAIAGLGDPKAALEAYEKAVEYDPDDPETLFWLGWLRMDRGSLETAESNFRQVLALMENQPDAWAARWARIGLGDILVRRGNLPAALKTFQHSLSAMERLAKSDPGNAGWQRDLSVSHDRIGDVQRDQGNLAAALISYQDSLKIRQSLAKSDPTNTEWQRDLSISHSKIGDVQADQGDLTAALNSFQAGLAIAERLAKSDPGNAGWQRDLSVSHEKIGDVQRDQGDLTVAVNSFQDSLKIRQSLAKSDPGNAGWQRDLSISHERIGDMLSLQGEKSQAIAAFEQAVSIYQALQARNPSDIPARIFSVVPLWRLGRLKGQAGRVDLQAALAILEPLAAANRLDANRKGWINAIKSDLAALG